jgi:hypothetical protein
MIPRKLHYVWLGGKALPPAMARLLDGWRALMPTFEVMEWNERNVDMAAHPWRERMYREGRYAFASDHVRLAVLRDHGGIYLDTDVELKKSLEPFLGERCFMGFEYDTFLSTAILGGEPGHPLFHALLALYDGREAPVVSNALVTDHFIRQYPELRLNNRDQHVGEGIRILPKEYFTLPGWDRSGNYARHHANNHWKGEKGSGIRPGPLLHRVLGDVLYYKLVNQRMVWNDTYRARQRELNRQRNNA